jgi:hypothetical protein
VPAINATMLHELFSETPQTAQAQGTAGADVTNSKRHTGQPIRRHGPNRQT